MSQLSLSWLIKFPSLTSEAALVDFVININTVCENRFLLQLPNLPLYKDVNAFKKSFLSQRR